MNYMLAGRESNILSQFFRSSDMLTIACWPKLEKLLLYEDWHFKCPADFRVCYFFVVPPVKNFPAGPLPWSSILTAGLSWCETVDKTERPTKSFGPLVAASPSSSHLAETINFFPTSLLPLELSPPHHHSIESDPNSESDFFAINSTGNFVTFSILIAKTAGGLPLVPSRIALGTLSGTSGRAVTYSAGGASQWGLKPQQVFVGIRQGSFLPKRDDAAK